MNLSSQSKEALLKKCNELGLTKYKSKTKQELINLITVSETMTPRQKEISQFPSQPKTYLQELCKEKGIKGYKNKSKNELIVLLTNHISQEEITEPLSAVENTVMDAPLSPLIKWSGGKSDEIDTFKQYIPKNYDTYLEPFIGGGALYFRLRPEKAVISDVHPELVDFYRAVKMGNGRLINDFMLEHPNTEETYYDVRDNMNIQNELDNAKRFYYLRKTCYRGMMRYNREGKFNIPFGRYKTINNDCLLNNEYVTAFQNTTILCTDFEEIFRNYDSPNNFMFLDPPYDSEFTDYGYCKFGKEEHRKLSLLFKQTTIKCLMVIGKTDFIMDLYRGYVIHEYQKKYRFKLHSGRIGEEIDNIHLVIANYNVDI